MGRNLGRRRFNIDSDRTGVALETDWDDGGCRTGQKQATKSTE